MAKTIPLKQWIRGALEASSDSNGVAALSPDYIEHSLRIAIALTRQITEAEDMLNSGHCDGAASLPPPFPATCIDWADCATVILKPNDDIFEFSESLSQLPSFRCKPLLELSLSDTSEDLDDLLGKISEDLNREEAKSRDSSAALREGNDENVSYFDVDSARIFYDNGAANRVDSPNEKLHRIYSLGLVFYELFSGGQLPPLELLVVASPSGGDLTVMSSGRVGGEETRYASCNESGFSDFTSPLNVSDGTSLARTSIHDNIEYYESKSEDHVRSISNKRQSVSSRSLKSESSSTGAKLFDVSFHCLDMKGVPHRLCDLICNMIDCINGEFMGNESYSEIADVTFDLELMLDKPSVYLHDLDLDKLSLAGLELDDNMFERDNEFIALQCAYRRSIAGSPELAIITGMAGTGKSTLAIRLGNFITATSGLFLSGKFDLQQVKPFSAVATAFNNYCDLLTREEESDRATLVASKLQTALGSDLYYLVQVIPNLRKLGCDNFTGIHINQDDCVDAQRRLQFLFSQFVEVISSCSGVPITLFMDDVQWADSASISIIGHLLKASHSIQIGMPLFFLGTCRDDEMESDHPFWKMIDTVKAFDFKTTLVELDCMDSGTVTRFIANLLHLSPRLVGSLSDIVYQKTKGIPLFVSKMLSALNREGLLRLSLTRYRWEWDEEKIQTRALPDDVAKFLVHSISTLPVDVKIALFALSCFGASTDFEIIQAIETDLNLNLIEPLNVAIKEAFVNKLDGRYCFCHDRIHEAAYSMIAEQDRCLHHMNYGLSLMSSVSRTDNTSLLFAAANQLNLGGPSAVPDAEKYYQIANCNLIAGKRAMEMSDFSSAFSFLDHGMTFLRKKHWQDQYDQSLEMFHLAAKCALAIKDLTSLTIICDEVSRNARNFEDTLNNSFVLMSALAHSKIVESVQFGLQVLSQLGVDIPSSSSRKDTLKLIIQTQSMLRGISRETFLTYHVLSDFKKVMTMKFLAKLENSIHQTNTSQQPIITMKIVQLTVEHGISPVSAIGFAYFGVMLAELGDIRDGYMYTNLAKTLLEKNQCNEIAGEVLFLSADFLTYIEPLQATAEYRIQGHATAMAAGDIHWACMNKLMFSWTLLWHGANLTAVRDAVNNAGDFSKEYNHITTLYYIETYKHLMARLIEGEDETLSTDQLTRNVIENKNPHQLVIVYFYKMFQSLVFNNYDEMKMSAEIYLEIRMPTWHLLCGHANHFFIGGLASFRIFRETQDPLWAQRGVQFKERINTWKDRGSLWNFENKSFLLEAEEFYCNGNVEKAQVSYENAVSSSRQHKFIHEEALACELAAMFYLNIGIKSMALKYFTRAHEAYFNWGAFAKVNALYAFVQENFESEMPLEASIAQGTGNDIHDVNLHT